MERRDPEQDKMENKMEREEEKVGEQIKIRKNSQVEIKVDKDRQ